MNAFTHKKIDVSEVSDWDSFHDLFTRTFDFPRYYGRNMDAWIDCMEDFAIGEDFLILELQGIENLKIRCPDIYEAINDCSAFINFRSQESGGEACIALSYNR